MPPRSAVTPKGDLGPPPKRETAPARTRCGPLYLLTDLLERAAVYADQHGVSRNDFVNAALGGYRIRKDKP